MIPGVVGSLSENGTTVVVASSVALWLLTIVSCFGAAVLGGETTSADDQLKLLPATVFTGVSSLIALLVSVRIDDIYWHHGSTNPQVARWLIGFAAAHFVLALAARFAPRPLRQLGFNAWLIGSVLLTIGLANAFSGPTLVIAWAAVAAAMAVRTRNVEHALARWVPAPLIGLCIVHILSFEVPADLLLLSTGAIPSAQLWDGVAALVATVVATVAATVVWAWSTRVDARVVAVFTAEAGVLYLAMLLLDGLALVSVFCALAVLAALLGRGRGPMFELAVPGFFMAAAIYHVLAYEASVESALSTGVDNWLVAAAALAAIAVSLGIWASRAEPREVRLTLTGIALLSLVYLGSVEIVAAFQPGTDAFGSWIGEFGVRQQGQALLSGFWAIAALGAIVYGLFNSVKEIRYAGLALLVVAVCKIVLFDLTSLNATYRTVSFIAVGAILLLAAFAYQNVKARVTVQPVIDEEQP